MSRKNRSGVVIVKVTVWFNRGIWIVFLSNQYVQVVVWIEVQDAQNLNVIIAARFLVWGQRKKTLNLKIAEPF